MTKPNSYPFKEDEKNNFFKYDIFAEVRNNQAGKYLIDPYSRFNVVDNIFRHNNYIPVDIYNKVVNISKIPILSPSIIVFGGFEYHCWEMPDNKVLPLFKELISKNLIDKILSYGEKSFAVEDLKKIKNYCKIYDIPFEFNDISSDIQFSIRKLKILDYENNKRAYSKDTSVEEFDKHLSICADAAKEVCNLFEKRAKYCGKKLEMDIKEFGLIVQILSLEEVINMPFIADELSKRGLSFISYVPDKIPH